MEDPNNRQGNQSWVWKPKSAVWQTSTGRNRTVFNSYFWKFFKNLGWNLSMKVKNLGFWLKFSTKHQGVQVNENTRQDSQVPRPRLRLTGAGFFSSNFSLSQHGWKRPWSSSCSNPSVLFFCDRDKFYNPQTQQECAVGWWCSVKAALTSNQQHFFCSATGETPKAPKVLKSLGEVNNPHSTYFCLADISLWALNDKWGPMGLSEEKGQIKSEIVQKPVTQPVALLSKWTIKASIWLLPLSKVHHIKAGIGDLCYLWREPGPQCQLSLSAAWQAVSSSNHTHEMHLLLIMPESSKTATAGEGSHLSSPNLQRKSGIHFSATWDIGGSWKPKYK